jgi:hypothetical protein
VLQDSICVNCRREGREENRRGLCLKLLLLLLLLFLVLLSLIFAPVFAGARACDRGLGVVRKALWCLCHLPRATPRQWWY